MLMMILDLMKHLPSLRCRREDDRLAGRKPPGHDLSLEDFDKIIAHFKSIIFCGQISDPTAHPLFHDFLRRSYEENINICVATAASHRKEDWYREAFRINPKAKWRFGIDGLPEESQLYRVNQDGEYLWRMALIAKEMGLKVEQQCIVFSYNEGHIDEVEKHATDAGITFLKLYSSRWNENEEAAQEIADKFFKEELKLSNVETVYDILQSEAWVNFYNTLVNDEDNAPLICKKMCSSSNLAKLRKDFGKAVKISSSSAEVKVEGSINEQ